MIREAIYFWAKKYNRLDDFFRTYNGPNFSATNYYIEVFEELVKETKKRFNFLIDYKF